MEKNLDIPVDGEAIRNVKLVSYSKPGPYLVGEGLYDVQELIAYCARVSNPSNQLNTETTEKLIGYLVKHQHWSPLEWSQPVSKLPPPETLQDKSSDIEVSAAKSSANDMLTLLKNCRSYLEKHDCKTRTIDKTV
jgi:hypothetical protein